MPTTRSLIVVAAIAVAVGVVGSYLYQQPGAVAMLSGGTPTPVVETPKDEVVPLADLSFKWKGSTDATRLVVIDLATPGDPIIDKVVTGDRYLPAEDERRRFVSGREYHWFVEAQVGGGSRSSAAAQFSMR